MVGSDSNSSKLEAEVCRPIGRQAGQQAGTLAWRRQRAEGRTAEQSRAVVLQAVEDGSWSYSSSSRATGGGRRREQPQLAG